MKLRDSQDFEAGTSFTMNERRYRHGSMTLLDDKKLKLPLTREGGSARLCPDQFLHGYFRVLFEVNPGLTKRVEGFRRIEESRLQDNLSTLPKTG